MSLSACVAVATGDEVDVVAVRTVVAMATSWVLVGGGGCCWVRCWLYGMMMVIANTTRAPAKIRRKKKRPIKNKEKDKLVTSKIRKIISVSQCT